MNSRLAETLDQRLELGLSESLKAKVEDRARHYFENDYEAGYNRSEMVRTSLEVLLKLIEICEDETGIQDADCMTRKYRLKKWIRDEILDREGGGENGESS